MRRLFSIATASCLVGVIGCSGGLGGADGGDAGNSIACDGGTISLAVTGPQCLWAPDHKMVLFDLSDVTVSVTGTCTVPTLSIVGVSSDQPALGGGQGNFAPDYTFNSNAVCLRSEREARSASGRTYDITIQATDGTTTVDQVVQVYVSHDQADGKCAAVDPSRVVADGDPRCN